MVLTTEGSCETCEAIEAVSIHTRYSCAVSIYTRLEPFPYIRVTLARRAHAHTVGYRGTSLTGKQPPPRTTLGP